MSLLISCQNLSKSHGSRVLFKNVSFGIFQGDKIGLIGPNGSGKSTLMKILAGIEPPDEGSVAAQKTLRISYVPQDSTFPDLSVEEILFQSLSQTHKEEHEKQTQVNILLSKLGFQDSTLRAQKLSGGWKKRLDIGKALIQQPQLLLLDEPTNHLDLEGILWLEKFLLRESLPFLLISHDRRFLENVTTRIVELNSMYPDGIFSVDGKYSDFLIKREDFLDYQQQCERSLSSKVRAEVEWLRQSPKARTVKAQARVQNAGRLVQELSEIKARNKSVTTKVEFSSAERQTKKLVALKNVSKSLSHKLLINNLTLTLHPGMRLGIIGPNGTGKTTLLKMLSGDLHPDKGTIKYADALRIVYFDQHREQLPLDLSLRRALSPNSDTVIYRDQKIHVNSWGKRFGFPPDRMDLPVKQLSGGEKARVQIARLMQKPADLLLLDEPTNDLDISTLETLEESLLDFSGAVVLISHDRALLERVCNLVIGLGLPGDTPILADYFQWEALQAESKIESLVPKSSMPASPPPAPKKEIKKLSYQEKKELDQMEEKILSLEQKIQNLQADADALSQINELVKLQEVCLLLAQSQLELEHLFQRWHDLEQKSLLS